MKDEAILGLQFSWQGADSREDIYGCFATILYLIFS